MSPNPQAEDGHIDISNEVAEQMAKLHLSGNEWQIIWVVLRKTWGWHKKEDTISLGQFAKFTGLSRVSCYEAIQKLLPKMVLLANKDTYITKYRFNKLYNEWTVTENGNSNKVLPKTVIGVTENGNRVLPKTVTKLLPKKGHTKEKKETYTKETIQKKGTFTTLKSLDETVLQEIADKYDVPVSFVKSKLDDMTNWLQSKGKVYKDYRAALSNWVKSDALKIKKDHNDRSKIAFINPE